MKDLYGGRVATAALAAALYFAAAPAVGEKGEGEESPSMIRDAFLKAAAQKKVLRIGMVDCIAYALRKNSEIKISRIEPKLRDDDIRIARSEFEPTLTGDYTLRDTTTKGTNIFFPVNNKERDITFNAGVSGKLATGATYRMDFLNDRNKTNADIEIINPTFSVEPVMTVTQPLFRGAGIIVNRADIIIARNNKKESVEAFKGTVIDIITQAKTGYYNYDYAIDGYAIAERYIERARNLLEINRARYAKGLVSSVDLLESEAAVADREKYLLNAEYNRDTAEDNLKYVTNLVDDPDMWNAAIELLDKPVFEVVPVDLLESLQAAFRFRPDYQAKLVDLKNRNIRIKVAKNALFPTLDAVGSFGVNGIDDTYRHAFDRLTFNYKDWTVGGALNIPWGMGDRARYDQSKWEKAQAILELQRLEQKIVLGVRDKVRAVDIQYRQERAARVSREKETENYEAQKERFAAGQVSTHDMLDYQDNLSNAELAYTKALVDYRNALISLDGETGLTLAKNNIVIEEKKGGRVACSTQP